MKKPNENAKIYSFSVYNKNLSQNISTCLERLASEKSVVVLCVGSDLVMGDSLGPLVGTNLTKKNVKTHVYGTLDFPITAKEIDYAKSYLKNFHPNSIVLAIDAAVGNFEDVGAIRVINKGIKPGLGVNKNLKTVGDISIIGVVAPKEKNAYKLLSTTRLNLIYKMAEQISNGIELFLKERQNSIAV
ncbi:MAG: spore protease YyaC [Clostridia bacterium]|nr:spore protease YyaC [Clostridia bacterium]